MPLIDSTHLGRALAVLPMHCDITFSKGGVIENERFVIIPGPLWGDKGLADSVLKTSLYISVALDQLDAKMPKMGVT